MKSFFLSFLKYLLRFLAQRTVRKYNPSIIGITGNVGKTSTKEAIYTVLHMERRVRAASKNFNNEFGLPLVILGNWKETGGTFFWLRVICRGILQILIKNPSYPEILILEYGVDRPGDMKYLLEIARPQIAAVTTIGDVPVHVEFFVGKEGIAREKGKIVAQLPSTGFAILNADDPLVMEMKKQTRAQVMTFGFSKDAYMKVSSFEESVGEQTGIRFKLVSRGRFVPAHIEHALGKTQAYSSAAAACVGLTFGMNLVKITEALSRYESPPGRLKIILGLKGSFIIDDTYNASPASMNEALDTMKRLEAKRKIAVLGDMLELGQYTIQAHEAAGKKAAKIVDILISVGGRGKFIAEAAVKFGMPRKNVFSFDNVRDAGIHLQNIMRRGDIILVKGSQGVRMEKIVKEIMADPAQAEKLLVRQNKEWIAKPGLYDATL